MVLEKATVLRRREGYRNTNTLLAIRRPNKLANAMACALGLPTIRTIRRKDTHPELCTPGGGEIGERRAARMSMAITFIISVVLYTANTSLNVFQILAGLFLSSTSTSESTIDAPNRLGVCITYTSIWRAWMSLDAEADSVAKKLFQLGKDGVQRLRAVVQVDNIDIWKRKTNETILNESSLIHMAASYIRAMPSYVDKEVFTPEFQEELLACEGSLKHAQFNQFKPNERDRNRLDQARRLNIAQILLLHLPFFVDHKDRATVVKVYNQQILDRFAKLFLAHHMPDEETRETKLYPLPAQPFDMGHTSHTANFKAWIKG
ncbi:hypothetical protein L202_04608 [Cryptococcus amylolentus CBS 6039]|uniref:Uncharacterized protein n=1 Tax=Cryptococcus amylolentus CBS 6039 TaxID=1295533 RepID=A0A1E3HM50_9TREE|nr:hypothetical protein L202_04608 [Cryptococcus amylolentus CBS 6039]ODN77429.1 hypothetical protein L202_04608 [Cryptococcus amylolentus CBS 6039]